MPRLKIYNSKNSGLDLEEYDTKFSEKDNYFSAVTEILNSSKNQNEKFAIVQYLDISKLEQGDDSFDYPDSYRVFKSIDFGKTWEPIIAETKFDKKNDSIYETRLSADDTIFLNTLYGYLNFIKKGNNENYSKVRNILSSNLINHLDINPIDPNEIILIKEYKDILNLRLEGSEWVTKNVKSFSFLNEEIKNLFFLSNLIN